MPDEERRLGVYAITPPPGTTRNCIDAWAMAFVRSDGGVCICCYSEVVANLADCSLDEALNSPRAMEYRQGLLTGKLVPLCASCPDKQIVSIETLTVRVQGFLERGDWGSDGTAG
jgi:hypothetical protein